MLILLIDDDADAVELYKEFFGLLGHEVHLARTAYDALNLVTKHEYDGIVLDILLPDLDGYALASRIRRLLAFRRRVSIVALSGMPFDPAHPLAAEANFDAYLLKPAHLDVILAALERCGA
ncbi:response regulator [Duganella guangzhouensis]|nr:response regulator [Duganella guangzhouensis]